MKTFLFHLRPLLGFFRNFEKLFFVQSDHRSIRLKRLIVIFRLMNAHVFIIFLLAFKTENALEEVDYIRKLKDPLIVRLLDCWMKCDGQCASIEYTGSCQRLAFEVRNQWILEPKLKHGKVKVMMSSQQILRLPCFLLMPFLRQIFLMCVFRFFTHLPPFTKKVWHRWLVHTIFVLTIYTYNDITSINTPHRYFLAEKLDLDFTRNQPKAS